MSFESVMIGAATMVVLWLVGIHWNLESIKDILKDINEELKNKKNGKS